MSVIDDQWAHDPEEHALVFVKSKPGWWRVEGACDVVYVGTRLDWEGRLVISRVLLAPEDQNVGTSDLRRVPLGRIAAFLNTDRGRAWAAAQPDDLDVVRLLEEAADEGPASPREPEERRERLRRPPSQGSEQFYEQVAAAYRFYARSSNKPAVEIAAEAAVPVPTARRWINEARRRGHLDPGQRGRTGG